jgi:hypothetical protein
MLLQSVQGGKRETGEGITHIIFRLDIAITEGIRGSCEFPVLSKHRQALSFIRYDVLRRLPNVVSRCWYGAHEGLQERHKLDVIIKYFGLDY